MEHLTFLQSTDNTALTKTFHSKNKDPSNPKTKYFSWHKVPIKNVKALAETLEEAVDNEAFAIVLGQVKNEEEPALTRDKENFKSGKSRVLILDIDSPGCDYKEYLEKKVPDEFYGKTCIVGYTARHLLKPGLFKFRLFYWLDKGVTLGQQKKLAEYFPGCDVGIYQPGRFIYTSKPLGKYAPKVNKRIHFIDGDEFEDLGDLLVNNLHNKIRKAAVKIGNVKEGDRNNEYFKIASEFAKRDLNEEQIEILKGAARDSGLVDREIDATWESARKNRKKGKGENGNDEENVYDSLARDIVEEKKYNVWETSEGLVVLQNPDNGTACELTEKDPLMRDFVNKEYFDAHGITPTRSVGIRVVDALRRFKDYNEKNIQMYKTICYLDGKLLLVKLGKSYYYINDREWGRVEVVDLPCVFASNNEYWEIELEEEVFSKNTLLSLLQDVTEFDNLENSEWIKIVLFILSCFNPTGIYNILMLQGSEGSGKSTVAEMINYLLEAHDHKSFSNNSPNMDQSSFTDWARYIGETCSKWHLICFDNVSKLNQDQSDLLCKLAVQSGIEYKKLYVQKPGVVKEAHPIIINSINDVMHSSDLRSRTFFVEIENSNKIINRQRLINRVIKAKPRFLSMLFDIISVGLEHYKSNKWIADDRTCAVNWACACAQNKLLGVSAGEFKRVFAESILYQKQEYVENNFFMGLLIKWIRSEKINDWEGTSTELKEAIEKKFIVEVTQNKKLWPDNVRSFGRAIMRCSKTAKDYLGVEFNRRKDKRGAKVWKIEVNQIKFFERVLEKKA